MDNIEKQKNKIKNQTQKIEGYCKNKYDNNNNILHSV